MTDLDSLKDAFIQAALAHAKATTTAPYSYNLFTRPDSTWHHYKTAKPFSDTFLALRAAMAPKLGKWPTDDGCFSVLRDGAIVGVGLTSAQADALIDILDVK